MIEGCGLICNRLICVVNSFADPFVSAHFFRPNCDICRAKFRSCDGIFSSQMSSVPKIIDCNEERNWCRDIFFVFCDSIVRAIIVQPGDSRILTKLPLYTDTSRSVYINTQTTLLYWQRSAHLCNRVRYHTARISNFSLPLKTYPPNRLHSRMLDSFAIVGFLVSNPFG